MANKMTDNLVEAVARAIHANDSYYKLPFDLQGHRDKVILDGQARAAVETVFDAMIAEEDAKREERRLAGASLSALTYLQRVEWLRAKKAEVLGE